MHELLNPEISNKQVSEVIYKGRWEDLKILKSNPRFEGYDENVWPLMAKDFEFFWPTWYPTFFFLAVMLLNFFIRVYQQFYSALIAAITLIYVSYGIPMVNRVREKNRLDRVDALLIDTPYHRSLFPELNEAIEKEIKDLVLPTDIKKDPTRDDQEAVKEKEEDKSLPPSKDNKK